MYTGWKKSMGDEGEEKLNTRFRQAFEKNVNTVIHVMKNKRAFSIRNIGYHKHLR